MPLPGPQNQFSDRGEGASGVPQNQLVATAFPPPRTAEQGQWDTATRQAPGPWNALLGQYLAPDPNATYGAILPTATDNTTGQTRLALPSFLRSGAQGVVDLLDGPATGTVTPDATNALSMLAGSNLLGRASNDAVLPAIRAFHGSPHDIERFSSDAIGTGEGAQAYGHGLYFAENEGVAQNYRDNLTIGRPNQAAADASKAHMAAQDAQAALRDKMVQETVDRFGNPQSQSGWGDLDVTPHPEVVAKYAPEWQAAIDRTAAAKAASEQAWMNKPRGHMYEVNIDAEPHQFLDWDKPLSEQSPHVQEALAKAGMTPPDMQLKARPDGTWEANFPGDRGRVFSTRAEADAYAGHFGPNPTGREILQARLPGNGDQVRASQALKDAGIPGIRYLDGGSRADGAGTSNHVVFDDRTIEILRKYGIAGLMAGGAATAAAAGNQEPPTQ